MNRSWLTSRSRRWGWQSMLLALIILLAGCERPSPTLHHAAAPPPAVANAIIPLPTPTLAPTGVATTPPQPTATTQPVATAEPISPTLPPMAGEPPFGDTRSPPCGQLLPLLPAPPGPLVEQINPDPAALARLRDIMPVSAEAALQRILDAPGTVGLAAYRVGQAGDGVYLNETAPMPLASVVKLLHLVAYVEAVAAGQLNPLSAVPVTELDRYYLPNFDLNAHPTALRALADAGRLFSDPPLLSLEAVPEMMVRYSSNAATDYLHALLGQVVIEETAVSLGLTSQTAPCPFVGQFLVISNHLRPTSEDQRVIRALMSDPAAYGREVIRLTDAYTQDDAFHMAEVAWREGQRRLSLPAQRLFAENLNAQGSALDYANLMARLAQNGFSNSESSFLARRYLEWPMRFPVNQEQFSNLGYKNGSLPGVLTTVYYAYPQGETTPVVIALFYRNLPQDTYRRWRNELPHDELARWLLADPAALPALRAVLQE
jgi:D-alanyl-D-alanine carboxypeptidase